MMTWFKWFRSKDTEWHDHVVTADRVLIDGEEAPVGTRVMRRIVNGEATYRAMTKDERFAAWDAEQW